VNIITRFISNWNRRHALLAALALVMLTNAVALLGVWYNRSGEPESQLTMSQRELWPPYDWKFDGENSATTLRLRWRVPLYDEEDSPSPYRTSYANSGGVATWFDRTKLETLGFDLKDEKKLESSSYSYSQLSKQAYLVLEFDGEYYQRALRIARSALAAEESASSDNAQKSSQQESSLKSARERLADEENKNSRLFIVDAGSEIGALRARYPDRNHYAIVQGEVKPALVGSGKKRWVMGKITDVAIDTINVPYIYRQQFEPMFNEHRRVRANNQSSFEVDLAFGKRLEPWITAVHGEMIAE
jgi:hypothetical protein